MTIQFNQLPEYNEPLTVKGAISRGWFRVWSGLVRGQPTGPTAGVPLGSSPFTVTAAQGGTLIVNGGTITQIQYSRDGANFFVTGLTAGMFPMSQGDQLRITYSAGTPVLTFVPR